MRPVALLFSWDPSPAQEWEQDGSSSPPDLTALRGAIVAARAHPLLALPGLVAANDGGSLLRGLATRLAERDVKQEAPGEPETVAEKGAVPATLIEKVGWFYIYRIFLYRS